MGDSEMTLETDWWANGIAIADIFATIVFGTIIAYLVQRNHAKSRYIREYFIGELKDIKDGYTTLFKEIYDGGISANHLKARLKIISCRISNLDCFIHQTYVIEKSLVKDVHFKFQQEITDTNEFNSQFKEPCLSFEPSTISRLVQLHTDIVKSITQRVLDINSAKRK